MKWPCENYKFDAGKPRTLVVEDESVIKISKKLISKLRTKLL